MKENKSSLTLFFLTLFFRNAMDQNQRRFCDWNTQLA